MILDEPYGPLLIYFCIISVEAADLGAWVVGRFLGKHHFSRISPNKTIEGVVGSFIVCFIVSAVFIFILPFPYRGNIAILIITSIVLPIVAFFGDISESLLKRSLNVKDMGDMLKGHGGFLDRIDSILFAFPVFYILSTFVFEYFT
jgi:phosphatidate cytidylyltransferase